MTERSRLPQIPGHDELPGAVAAHLGRELTTGELDVIEAVERLVLDPMSEAANRLAAEAGAFLGPGAVEQADKILHDLGLSDPMRSRSLPAGLATRKPPAEA